MRVLLFEPSSPTSKYFDIKAQSVLEPLGLEWIASYLEKMGHECEVIQQRFEKRHFLIERILDYNPSLLGISAQAYNYESALWFATNIKNQSSTINIVLGGYHATGSPDLALASNLFDFVISGEGEYALLELIEALEGRRSFNEISGLTYKTNGNVVSINKNAIHPDLNKLPFPKRYHSLINGSRINGLMFPPLEDQRAVATVMAARGCPYQCMYCSSNQIWGRRVRYRRSVDVADELDNLITDFHVDTVFFTDLTFNANKRYAIDLCGEIVKRRLPIHFYAMCNLRGMDKEIADAMAKAGCIKIGFGIESTTELTRIRIKDGGGFDLPNTNAVLDQITDAGIFVKTYIIIGFPWETHEILYDLKHDIERLNSDELKISFYVPFLGTKGYAEHKKLIRTNNWSRFTLFAEPIVRNEMLSPQDFVNARHTMYSAFYNGERWYQRAEKWSNYSEIHYKAITAFKRQLMSHMLLN